METQILDIITLAASLGGFFIAAYIFRKKEKKQVLACPIGASCDLVVKSEHSQFFGIRLEILGMIYYGIVFASAVFFLLAPDLGTQTIKLLFIALSATAFLFSLYLTFLQAFVIRDWCSWCLLSAGMTTVILLTTFIGANANIIDTLAAIHDSLIVFHVLGVVLGFGGTVMADIMFFKFLKDGKVSTFENDVLRTISQVIWFALALLLLTGAGLFVAEMELLSGSPKFLTKMVVVGVILVNGALLNIFIAPHFEKIIFGGVGADEQLIRFRRLKKLAFALGAISTLSWGSAFLLGALRRIPMDLGTALGVYGAVLLIGVMVSQIMERRMRR